MEDNIHNFISLQPKQQEAAAGDNTELVQKFLAKGCHLAV